MKKIITTIFLSMLATLVSANVLLPYKGLNVVIPNRAASEVIIDTPACLVGRFAGDTGTLRAHKIPLDFTGRYTIGDVNNDGHPDFVVTRKNKMVAYDVCGNKLWRKDGINTYWENENHVFWAWTSFGFVGDADGDGESEVLYIGESKRTLYVLDGKTGNLERAIDLGDAEWMYVALGRRSGEAGNTATRIYVTGRPSRARVKAIDIRNNRTVVEFDRNLGRITNSYMPPHIANLNQSGDDEIVHGTTAFSSLGNVLWNRPVGGFSVINAGHTLQVDDIDPSKPGLEATYSVYAPIQGAPSIVSMAFSNRTNWNWLAYSPHSERHPHQHDVGDFVPGNNCLETLVRNGDGRNHWIASCQGNILERNIRLNNSVFPPRHWDGGEIIQGINWDENPGEEILYTERHVDFKEIPKLVITSSSRPTTMVSPFFHGGINVPKFDTDPSLVNGPSRNSWFPFVDRGVIDHLHQEDGPYEGNSHVVDVLGDGREEVVAMADRALMIYFNSGDAGVPKRWGEPEYMAKKKLWCQVYNTR